jgi:hypothetical protein
MAARAVSFSEEEALTGLSIAGRRLLESRCAQSRDESRQCIQILLRKGKIGHARIRKAVLDKVHKVPVSVTQPSHIRDIGAKLTTATVSTVTTGTAVRKLLPSRVVVLRDSGPHAHEQHPECEQ